MSCYDEMYLIVHSASQTLPPCSPWNCLCNGGESLLVQSRLPVQIPDVEPAQAKPIRPHQHCYPSYTPEEFVCEVARSGDAEVKPGLVPIGKLGLRTVAGSPKVKLMCIWTLCTLALFSPGQVACGTSGTQLAIEICNLQ